MSWYINTHQVIRGNSLTRTPGTAGLPLNFHHHVKLLCFIRRVRGDKPVTHLVSALGLE